MTISNRELDLQMVGSPFLMFVFGYMSPSLKLTTDSEFSLENRPKLHQNEMKSFERTIGFSVV